MSKEYVLKRLEALGLIDKNQITQAIITMYSTSSEDEGFPICELRLRGISPKYEADIVSLAVRFDGSVVKEADIPVMKGESDRYLVKVKKDIVEKLGKDMAECSFGVADPVAISMAVPLNLDASMWWLHVTTRATTTSVSPWAREQWFAKSVLETAYV